VSRVYRRLSLAQGSSLCTIGVLTGLALLVVVPRFRSVPVDLLLLLVAWFCLWFFSHDLTHHIVGRIVGVGFRYYFVGRSAITRLDLPIISDLARVVPVLGLKIERSTLRSVSPGKVRAMYDSGAVASMFLPWLIVPTGYAASFLVGVLLTLLSLANLVFTLYFSTQVGDLRRASRIRG
jgi:hypothetical protein